ncbi:MAG: NAD(P)H-hydrate dehydratase [Candidatus Cloacimonetes bacterium]|nr:NAD(P)H-hydrate dehydratase [Candidatus Cloacimonadota bacterium]
MDVLSSNQMYESDSYTIDDLKIPALLLMEQAGGESYNIIKKLYDKNHKVAVLCGTGNNGGDGYVIARRLLLADYDVTVFQLGDPKSTQSSYHHDILKNFDIDILDLEHFQSMDYQVVVDCIFGIGLSKDISDDLAINFDEINLVQNIVSIDIPSGICSDSGCIRGASIEASHTIVLQHYKRGHFLYPGSSVCGQLHLVDIGVYKDPKINSTVQLINDLPVRLPSRNPWSHKGMNGRVLVIGGLKGKLGALHFASLACSHTGTGLVFAGSSKSAALQLQTSVPEVMGVELSEYDEYLDESNLPDALEIDADLVILGPGLGRHENTKSFVRKFVRQCPSPVLLDADALHAFETETQMFEILSSRSAETILTPHPGEFAAMLKMNSSEIDSNRIELLSYCSHETKSTIVLKDSTNLICNGDYTYMHAKPNSVLAKGGSGDVLAGLIASFFVQGMTELESCIQAVLVQSKGAEIMRDDFGEHGGSPLRLIDGIGKLMKIVS